MGYYNSPTEHTALLPLLDPFKAPRKPVSSVSRASTPIVLSADREAVKRLVEAEFGEGHVMVAIARAESRFDPVVKNPRSTATGVFQILVGTWQGHGCTGNRTDAEDNIACARKIYDRNGTRDWNASAHAW